MHTYTHQGSTRSLWPTATHKIRTYTYIHTYSRDLRAHYGLSGMAAGSVLNVENSNIADCGYADGAAAFFMSKSEAKFNHCKIQECIRYYLCVCTCVAWLQACVMSESEANFYHCKIQECIRYICTCPCVYVYM
jgi:hypothetical protein